MYFIPKTNTKISIAITSNKVNNYKVSFISKSSAEVYDNRLQVFLNLFKT